MEFLNSHGGILAVLLVVVMVLNILLSAVGQVFAAIHATEPGWLGKAAGFISKALDWLSANVKH